jgi:hyperosmotically inducible protein
MYNPIRVPQATRKLLIVAMTLAAAGSLAGCAAALIGGAAAGGYYAGKDDRSAGQIATDSRITTAVKNRLITDPKVKALSIDVDTRESIVTLRGEVHNSEQRVAAAKAARSVSGVKGVRDELRLRSK